MNLRLSSARSRRRENSISYYIYSTFQKYYITTIRNKTKLRVKMVHMFIDTADLYNKCSNVLGTVLPTGSIRTGKVVTSYPSCERWVSLSVRAGCAVGGGAVAAARHPPMPSAPGVGRPSDISQIICCMAVYCVHIYGMPCHTRHILQSRSSPTPTLVTKPTRPRGAIIYHVCSPS